MKSIYSISVAAVFSSLVLSAAAVENYSLWPRRPDELEQARRLMQEQKGGEAVLLLQPFLTDRGIAGREARQICGRVNVPRYLSRMHPGARVYTVRKGDNIARIAAREKCPQDVLMMLNGIVEPSALRVGQKLVLVPMNLRVEIYPLQREISVWDGNTLVADYPITGVDDIPRARQKTQKTKVSAREGYLGGHVVLSRAPQFPSSERSIILANGMSLVGGANSKGNILIYMEQKDLNELAMMLDCGNEVTVYYPGT
ncbi:MAG: LysM peptidoglycan-binding domain-containing protein [Akkermansia sp.]|nr:LysM peptidoglycan-binding domain-containing protein [Akkermansia sp.]